MSDLAATNCGCSACDGGNNCSWIIILILLFSCCGNGSRIFGGGDNCGCNNNCSCIWIILILLFCCGNGSGISGICC